jgi:hypothetical protein
MGSAARDLSAGEVAAVATTSAEKMWRIIGNQEENLKALTRLVDTHCADDERRHVENLERLDAIREKQLLNADAAGEMRAVVKELNERLEKIMPMMRRLRAREVFRRSVIQCLSRWRHAVVAAGIGAGGLFVWLDGHWPKIAAMLRKLLGGG